MSYISEIQDTIPRVLNYFWKDLLVTEMEQSRIEETHATQFEIPTEPVFYSKEVILIGQGSGMTSLPAILSKKTLFQPISQDWS